MGRVTLKVSDGSEMNAHTARSKDAPTKGIVVIQEAFGVNDYIRRITRRFADQGYLAIAPELFHRTASGFDADYVKKEGVSENMAALTDEGIVADLKASYDWLVGEGIPNDKIAVIGFCMGGRAAFLANATLPLAAAVSFYGGGTDSLLSRVQNISGPMLFFWGEKDTHIPLEQRQAVLGAMKNTGKSFEYEVFPEAGHGFACDARDAYHKPSADAAWVLADAFLAEHLK